MMSIIKEASNGVHFYWITLSCFFIALPYIGPGFLGLIGIKPIWIIFIFCSVVFLGQVNINIFVFMALFFFLDTIRILLIESEISYEISLWMLMFIFISSRSFFREILHHEKMLRKFSMAFYGLFLCLYIINYLNSDIYEMFLRALVGQARTQGRSDFAFLSPESGLGSFSILIVAYLSFHVSSTKHIGLLIVPSLCLLVIHSATAVSLALIWSAYYILNTRLSFNRAFLVIFMCLVFFIFFAYFSSDLLMQRFFAVINFDLYGSSSVSLRAQDVLRLFDLNTYMEAGVGGSVGIVKAVIFAPFFSLAFLVLAFLYCKSSDFLLIFPALILLPLTHPFVWVIVGISWARRTTFSKTLQPSFAGYFHISKRL